MDQKSTTDQMVLLFSSQLEIKVSMLVGILQSPYKSLIRGTDGFLCVYETDSPTSFHAINLGPL